MPGMIARPVDNCSVGFETRTGVAEHPCLRIAVLKSVENEEKMAESLRRKKE